MFFFKTLSFFGPISKLGSLNSIPVPDWGIIVSVQYLDFNQLSYQNKILNQFLILTT